MMNTSKRLSELVKNVIEPHQKEMFTPESLLLDAQILDSFGLVQFVLEIEKEFSIAIRTEDLTSQNFATITDVAALVDSYIAKT